MTSTARFADWPWRDFGRFAMTEAQAAKETEYARIFTEQAGIPGSGLPWRVSAAAGIGQPAAVPN